MRLSTAAALVLPLLVPLLVPRLVPLLVPLCWCHCQSKLC
jgi:hypothetical protein